MKNPVLAVLLASLATYFFGFLYWGASGLPYRAWEKAPDDATAQDALRKAFPVSGTYHVPAPSHSAAELEALYKGPVGFVHVDLDGRPVHDTSVMIYGFALTVVVCALLALVLAKAGPALPTYGARVGFVSLLGVLAAVMYDGGGVVWWKLPLGWQAVQALYNFGAWLVAGLVLARYVR